MPPVEIHELVTRVEVTDSQSVLSPEVLARIVEAVLEKLRRDQQAQRARRTEHDLRPIVEQQRDAGRWGGGGC
jgi:hypothetical protein